MKTDRATGIVGKFTDAHPRYSEEHEHLRGVLGITADALRMQLLEPLNPKAPPVTTVGALYRYE